jgi:hypothetical protein
VSGGLLRPMSLDIGLQVNQVIEDKLGFIIYSTSLADRN